MNIVITGCSKGIGLEIVKNLLISPDNKIIGVTGNSNIIAGFSKSELDNFIPLVFNLAEIFSKSDLLINRIKEHFSHIDILINNAGILINKPFPDFSYQEILESFTVNCFAPAELTKLLIPFMSGRSTSHVVNISSMGGFQGSSKYKGLSWYSSSKAALSTLTECLAEELKDNNIHVNCLALGAVETEMFNIAFPGFRAPVTAAEMGKFIAGFALNGHNLFNGKIIPVALSNP